MTGKKRLILLSRNATGSTANTKKASKTSATAKHANSYGKKAGSQMDGEPAVSVKIAANTAQLNDKACV